MEKSTFRRYSILGQVAAWSILFLINLMEQLDYESPLYAFLYELTSIGYLIPTVYIHYYWLLPLFSKGKKWIYFIATFCVITFFLVFYELLDSFIPTNFPDSDG